MSNYYNDNNHFENGDNPLESQSSNSNDVFSSSDNTTNESKQTESS